MKRTEILLIFFAMYFVTICSGQKVSGMVTYKISLVNFGADNKDKEFKELNDATVKIANQQTCTLKFNSRQSSSVLDKYLISDVENNGLMRMARTMAFVVTNESDYFFDKFSNTAIKREDNGNLIKGSHKKVDWEITTESKQIDRYLCYKAIYYDKFVNRKGVSTSIPIVAWFAPSLPYAYGPKYFNGLPGLILELNDRETTFYATTIVISNVEEVEIEFPKGKTVSQEDYTKKIMSN